jgi:hypothetical protein
LVEARPGTVVKALADRLGNLLPLVRNHVYHPDLGGSFSLKSVLPAMVPELRYATLAIGDGKTASLELERLVFQKAELTPEAKAQLRSDLLRYNYQDTSGLVKLSSRGSTRARTRSGRAAPSPCPLPRGGGEGIRTAPFGLSPPPGERAG